MERDPILYAWRCAPRHHAAAAGLGAGLGLPLALFALLCLRDLIGLLGPDGSAPRPFLALVLPLPGEAATQPLTLLPGWPLGPDALVLSALLGLAGSALALAALGWAIGKLCFEAQSRAAGRLRAIATDAILRSPGGAREDLRALPGLVVQVLSGITPLTAAGIVVPVLACAGTLLALLLAAFAALRLMPAFAVGLLAIGLSRLLLLRRAETRAALRARERAAAQSGLVDLIQRMPAVRTHGAATFERRRLGLRALAARGTLARSESALAYARAPLMALVVLLPAILVATALWRGEGERGEIERILPGALAAAAGAFAVAAVLIAVCLRLWFVRQSLTPVFRTLAVTVDALSPRPAPAGQRRAAFPNGGALVASGAGAYDPVSGERMNGVDLNLPMPAHVAIVGPSGSGARALAAMLAGQIEPTAGSLTYGGTPLRSLDPTERAHRIAFAGAEAILIEGTLKQNLLYGARNDDRGALGQEGRIAVVKLAGLDPFIYARGLEGTVDPDGDPSLARAIVGARQAMRAALEENGISRFVEHFDPERYNHQASVGENILFGQAKRPAFSQGRLAGHPYLRAVLEAEDLTLSFLDIGLQIAGATVEIFSDLPDDHPLFESFSLFPARERGFFEDLIARQPEAAGWRRGLAGQRDRERVIGLTLRYSETRHRFGLIDEACEARIVDARRSFAALLPQKFREKVEFYDPRKLTAAASLQENILFGRITQGEAGAEGRVRTLIRRVLSEQGLEPVVYRLGLMSHVASDAAQAGPRPGPRRSVLSEGDVGSRERIAIELVRCLVRRPDLLVIALPLDEKPSDERRERLTRLRGVRRGKGLIVCVPNMDWLAGQPPFDAVIMVERNAIVPEAAPAETAERVG